MCGCARVSVSVGGSFLHRLVSLFIESIYEQMNYILGHVNIQSFTIRAYALRSLSLSTLGEYSRLAHGSLSHFIMHRWYLL